MEDQNNKSDFIFQSITLIGIGLIGSSIARAIKKRNKLAKNLRYQQLRSLNNNLRLTQVNCTRKVMKHL